MFARYFHFIYCMKNNDEAAPKNAVYSLNEKPYIFQRVRWVCFINVLSRTKYTHSTGIALLR